MLVQLKRNDDKQSLVYIIQNEDGSTPILTGATVQFVMGKKNKLVINSPAVIQSATDGIVSYEFNKTDTLIAGNYMAEFIVTFATGEQQTFPNRGYISVNIEANLDTSLTNIAVDMIAERQGEFTKKLDSILLQAGNISMSTMNEYTWTSTAEQITYDMPTNANYDPFGKWFEVYVGGVPVDPSLIDRSVANKFTLLINPSLVPSGTTVHAKWIEPIIPVTVGHHSVHELNGADEIDITKLRNYQQYVVSPLGTTVKKDELCINIKDYSNLVVNTDWSPAFDVAVAKAKSTGLPLFIPSGTYVISKSIDISGITIEGETTSVFNTSSIGTWIVCLTKTFSALKQISSATGDITFTVKNLTIKDSLVGLETGYSVNSSFSNLFFHTCDLAVKHGDSAIIGGLFNTFINIYTNNCVKGLDIHGKDWANNNVFTNCYFNGSTYGATINCNGGLGAVNNTFISCEFASSNGRGITLTNARNTTFLNPYFEAKGNAIRFQSSTATTIIQPVLGSLKNTNSLGDTSFFHLEVTASITLIGGCTYLVSGSDTTGLYQFSSPTTSEMQNVKVLNDVRHLSMTVPFHVTAINNQGIIVRANDGFNWQITVNTSTGAVGATKLT